MSEFQVFVDYSWAFFIGAILIRYSCWVIGYGISAIKTSIGEDK